MGMKGDIFMAITSRVWELSTNLKDKDGNPYIDLEKLKDELEKRSVRNKGSIENYAFIIHDKDIYTQEKILKEQPELYGKPKTPHIHCVMKFSYNQDLERITEWFGVPANFFEKASGRNAWEEKCLYLTHEDDKQQALGKHLYSDDEITADFDFREFIDDYKAKKLEMKSKYGKTVLTEKEMLRMDVLQFGLTLKQAMLRKPVLFAEDYNTLKKMRGFYLQQQTPPPFRLNLYIEGTGGVGKDLMARSIARSMYPDILDLNEVVFEVGADKVSFDGYDGQPVIIWRDVRAGELIGKFGRENLLGGILEPFQGEIKHNQHVKYDCVSLVNSVNIFTGADPWADFLNGLVGEYTDKNGRRFKSENKAQSYRRFPLIIPVSQSDFDIMLNEGFMQDNHNWTQYFVYKNISGNFAQTHAFLSGNEQKTREIEDKMSSHVIGAVEEIQEKTKRKELTDEEIEKMFADYGKAKTGAEIEAEREAQRKAEEREKMKEIQRQIEAKRFGNKVEDDDGSLPF